MKVAFIPPPSMPELMIRTGYALVLPPSLQAMHLMDFLRTSTAHKILDNGAAEGALYSWVDLHKLAQELNAQEIVVPDYLSNVKLTMATARGLAASAEPESFDYVGVVQGETLEEAWQCLESYVSLPYITVLAVPRVLANNIRQLYDGYGFRIKFIAKVLEEFPARFKAIHCLGASRWVKEVKELALFGEAVRGIDTSLPVYLGYMHRSLSRPVSHERAVRPKGYLHFGPPSPEQRRLIYENCQLYYEWAGGTEQLFPTYEEASSSEV